MTFVISFFTCSLPSFNDMSKTFTSIVVSFVVVVVVGFWGEGVGCYVLFEKDVFLFYLFYFLLLLLFFFFGGGWKICNVSIMFLLSYVHACVTRTGWKTRRRPKTVILPIKKSIQIKSNQIGLKRMYISSVSAE